MATTDPDREGPGIRREAADLQEGAVVHVDDIHAEYGVVTRTDPAWIHYVRSGLEARARAIPAYQVVDADEVLGVDSEDATHLWDRAASEVRVMQRSEDTQSHFEAERFEVPQDSLGRYLVWLETEHDREWRADCMPEHVRELLEQARVDGGGAGE